jgi:hypothetical protein
MVDGKEAQARRWREIFSTRPAGAVALRDLVVLTAAEAVAQLGSPPQRLAALVKPGAWIAVADLSRRPVILIVLREGDRYSIAGMHG